METVFDKKIKRSLRQLPYSSEEKIRSFQRWGDKKVVFLYQSFCYWSVAIFMLFCMNPTLSAQMEPQFSQNMFNPLMVNPGFAGSSGRINVVAADRHQWVGLEGSPRTTVVGADMALKNLFGNPGGVGLIVMNDEIGFFRNITIQGAIAQRYFVGDGMLGVGVNFGIQNQVFDGTKVVVDPGGGGYHNPDDPLISGSEETGTALDAGIGAWFKRSDFYAGISILHLFEPKPNFSEQLSVYIPRSFFLTAGYTHPLQEMAVDLEPSFFLKNSGHSWQLDINMNVVFRDRYWGGLSYRIQDAVVLLGGIELPGGLRVGYSYDITTSRLSGAGSNGSHEIMVGYNFDLSLERREKRYRSVRFL